MSYFYVKFNDLFYYLIQQLDICLFYIGKILWSTGQAIIQPYCNLPHHLMLDKCYFSTLCSTKAWSTATSINTEWLDHQLY